MIKKQINNLFTKPFIMTKLATIIIITIFIILLFILLNTLYFKKEEYNIKNILYKNNLFRKLF